MGRRRACAALLAAAIAAPFARRALAALPGVEGIAFQVFRDGKPLGRHRVSFRREAGELHVHIDIRLEVRFAFLTVFSYRHRNHEVWRDDRLIAIETETDDDGERYRLRGRANAAGFEVEGSSGRFLAPLDVMPTSYWNPRIVERRELLDTQRGRLITVDIAPSGSETISMAGHPVNTRHYRMTGDLTLDLWYTDDGEWAKISFEARGAEVVYARQADAGALGGPEGMAGGQ